MKRKFLLILTVALVSVMGAQAKVVKITESVELKEMIEVYPGDTLILGEGTWTDVNIRIRVLHGIKEKPAVFKGETAGKTILKGLSSLSFSGYGLIVEDLWFEDPQSDYLEKSIVQFRTIDTVQADAHECILRNCRFTDYNNEIAFVDNTCQWVSVFGTNNIVENCSFEDRAWLGVTLVVWPEPEYGGLVSHIIRNNYFSRPRYCADENGRKYNGQESIRVGTSHVSLSDAGCLIENNMFEKCSGEAEIISIKTGNNIVRGNVFLGCEGTLTLRHGNGSLVEDNYMDGLNIPGTGGIRVVGTDHVIRNNYMQNIAGQDGVVYAICVMMGVRESVLNNYSQVERSVFENNVAIDCAYGLGLNRSLNRENQDLPFASSRFTNNVFVSTKVAAQVFGAQPYDVIWANNVFQGGEFIGTTAQELGATSSSTPIERKAMPVFEFGPEWKHLYE